ncbi:MAG: TrkA family potassium uptake protein [Bacteroidetes bacterium]|nr:TrkA family potassium uptake protein [Bacteroidota bacterium]MBV6462282.1 Ktr system potassium uptake protein A [Flavobacteriales bacterium]WKZ74866.1 MAG: TrkA family potassium uptake protein [Vicingaceae bacterium]MCL4816088.1 TrkA family potassium uptake protein [Flavobacteriales bacterium]NOG95247.1 TrkA family potassium uptake protein [Bacteroidota bacterium]
MKGSRFAVIGLGQFGSEIARILAKKGAEVMAIDNNETHIENIKDEVAYAVCLDAADKKALKSQEIEKFDAVVVAIGEDFETLLLCTVFLQELKAKRIIARGNGAQQRMILEKIGIKEILSPEQEVGRVVAEKLLNPNVVGLLQLPDDYEIAEIKAPKGVHNRTLTDIALRDKYKLNLVTIKRDYEVKSGNETKLTSHIIGVPSSETIIYDTDTIVVFGTIKDIQKFTEINQ